MLHYQPRLGKQTKPRSRIHQRYTQCADCDQWKHCVDRNKAWLCLECRTNSAEQE